VIEKSNTQDGYYEEESSFGELAERQKGREKKLTAAREYVKRDSEC